MFKYLITSGCSFTESHEQNTWATFLAQQLNLKLINLGEGGAGNNYISDSVINESLKEKYAPKNTLIVVMWSGIGRKDLLISGEFYNLLDYPYKKSFDYQEDKYYVFSGGMSNSWIRNKDTRKLFENLYKSSDPYSLVKDSLFQIYHLQNYLKVNKFKYRFLNMENFFNPDIESTTQGDYTIGHFARDLDIYKALDFSKWIFINNNKDGIYEYCLKNNLLGPDNFHPSIDGHESFVQKILLPEFI